MLEWVVLGSSLRSPAEGEGHEGFPPPPDPRCSPRGNPAYRGTFGPRTRLEAARVRRSRGARPDPSVHRASRGSRLQCQEWAAGSRASTIRRDESSKFFLLLLTPATKGYSNGTSVKAREA